MRHIIVIGAGLIATACAGEPAPSLADENDATMPKMRPDAEPRPDAAPASDAAWVFQPVRSVPGLSAITFYERTGGTEPTAYTFSVNGLELTTRLADPLSGTNQDFAGVPETEIYDVYYSNADGAFNLDGSYLTISGVYGYPAPNGAGLNLAEIALVFSDGEDAAHHEYGSIVGSYAALGDTAFPESVIYCIDGNLETNTAMGNTYGTSERLRITLGFPSTVLIN